MRYATLLTACALLLARENPGAAGQEPGDQAKKKSFTSAPKGFDVKRDGIERGKLETVQYESTIVGINRKSQVYTPPGYESSRKQKYPVLYLLHGFSDDASGWTTVGRANVILDNLIAQGKAKPMVIVMPLAYGTMEIVRQGWEGWGHADLRDAISTDLASHCSRS